VGARFFAYVQIDPGAHPASCIVDAGIKRLGRDADHTHPSVAKVPSTSTHPLGLSSPVMGLLNLSTIICSSALTVITRPLHRPFVLVSSFGAHIYILSYLKIFINSSILWSWCKFIIHFFPPFIFNGLLFFSLSHHLCFSA
jgi:hypothetical protein